MVGGGKTGGSGACGASVARARASVGPAPNRAWVRRPRCAGCRPCAGLGPLGAIPFDAAGNVAAVNEVLCKGCGVCVAACPSGALQQHLFTDEQLLAELEGVLTLLPEQGFEPRIVAFFCTWCTYTAADLAGISRLEYAPNVRVAVILADGPKDTTGRKLADWQSTPCSAANHHCPSIVRDGTIDDMPNADGKYINLIATADGQPNPAVEAEVLQEIAKNGDA